MSLPSAARLLRRAPLCLALSVALPGTALAQSTIPATTPSTAADGADSSATIAPAPVDKDAQTLGTIVVTASGFEQKLVDAPASVSVVTREELTKRPYTGLVDALRDVEGVDVGMESTDKNGMATVSMRGLPSDYTLVLIDGRRQSNVGDLFPNNFGGSQFAFVPPLDAIERIEVVRGPMSTLYGSDAMGGVINVITRKVPARWLGSVTHGRTFQQDNQFGNDYTTDVYLAGPIVPGKLGLSLRGSQYVRQASNPEWEPLLLPDGTLFDRTIGFGGGGRSVASDNWNAGLRVSFMPNDNHEFLLDADMARQKFDNSEGQTGTLDSITSFWRAANATIPNPAFNPALPVGPSNPATIVRRVVQPRVGYTDCQRYERDQVALTHVGRWDIGTSTSSLMTSTTSNLGRSLPLTIQERDDLQGLWNAACIAGGGRAYCANANQANLTGAQQAELDAFLPRQLRTLEIRATIFDTRLDMTFGNHQVTVGGQYNDAEMEDGVFGIDGDGFAAGTVQPHEQWAVFAEDNWALGQQFTLTVGARYDDHNIFGDAFSPRAYLVWRGSEQWTVKGGVSTGYKTPKPNQLFPGIVGFGGQGVLPLVGNTDLQPETSINYEIATYYDNLDGWSFNATAFLTEFKDKIASGVQSPNCEVVVGDVPCVDIGPGWAALGYAAFSQSVNIDRARTHGVELASRLELPANLVARANYTYTDSQQRSGAAIGSPIGGNPARHMFNANLSWQATEELSVFLAAEARSDRFRDISAVTGEERYYADYTILHLGGTWQATDWLAFNARINNLLDKDFISQTCELAATQDTFTCQDDYLVKDQRRSLWMSVNVRF